MRLLATQAVKSGSLTILLSQAISSTSINFIEHLSATILPNVVFPQQGKPIRTRLRDMIGYSPSVMPKPVSIKIVLICLYVPAILNQQILQIVQIEELFS
jgi:hypothetical protein